MKRIPIHPSGRRHTQGSTRTVAHWKEKSIELWVQYRDASAGDHVGLVRSNIIAQQLNLMKTYPGRKDEDDKDEPPRLDVDAELMHQTGPTATLTGWKLRRANKLLEKGRPSKALELLTAAPLASLNKDTKDKLQDLHPSDPHPHTPITAEEIALEREEHTTELTIEVEDFKKYFAIRDMTSAGGPAEWNFKRIQQVLMLPEPDPTALEGFCSMLSDIVRGLPYDELKEDLKASRLIALTKPDTGIRPIAIGEVFTRTAVGTLMTKHRDRLMLLLHETQVGKYLGGARQPSIQYGHDCMSIQTTSSSKWTLRMHSTRYPGRRSLMPCAPMRRSYCQWWHSCTMNPRSSPWQMAAQSPHH
jgi:hypothetical protein